MSIFPYCRFHVIIGTFRVERLEIFYSRVLLSCLRNKFQRDGNGPDIRRMKRWKIWKEIRSS